MTIHTLSDGPAPTILTVPGLLNSGPDHWQSLWEKTLPDCHRVDLGSWDAPQRNAWVTNLSHAIARTSGPVVLAAHSLGCHAVAWWAAFETAEWHDKVLGALLVAPPEVDSGSVDRRLVGFGPTPKAILPFPSIVAASRNDPYISFASARRLSQFWGSQFADAGEIGHINADSGLGEWRFGQFLLQRLIDNRLDTGRRAAWPDARQAEARRSAEMSLRYGF